VRLGENVHLAVAGPQEEVVVAQFQAFAPGIEINGETVLSVVRGVGPWADAAKRILAQNGIEDPQPGRWYPQQAWLDAFRTIAEMGGRTLHAIGKSVPQNARWPPEIKSVKDALASIDVAYHMNHAKGGRCLFDAGTGKSLEGIGHYRYRDLAERKAEVTCENPYPCAFDGGIVFAVAEKFRPAESVVRVDHGEACRAKGAPACVLTVTW
jgi:hypothetical protein